MRRRVLFLFILFAVFASVPRFVAASPEKAAGPLEVTYYFLPG